MSYPRPADRGRMRYDWWRAHHGLPQHAKWRSVAKETNLPVSVVFHIAACLLDLASRSTPRGSIVDFKPFDCASIVDISTADVERVIAVLRDVHWIEGHILADWDERQPQREDVNTAQRKAEQRANSHTPSRMVTHSHTRSHNVTNVSTPDIDIDTTLTSSEYDAAREESPPKAEQAASKRPSKKEEGLKEEGLTASPALEKACKAKGWVT